uniref:cytochrome P450 2K4-like n=1 Tax=Monopterus albus TaxID=43700 RepID=UPI0009B49FB6
MGILDVLLQSSSSVSLLGTLAVLLLVYIVSSFSFNKVEEKDPPGPRPLPLLGNLLQLDLKKPHITLLQLSKKYGSVFTVYLGQKKVVVLAGYKTVKEALVNHAEEFGERDLHQLMYEKSQGNACNNNRSYQWHYTAVQSSGITNSHFNDVNLMTTVRNLFIAGTETSATTLRWGLLLMAKYPKIQDQVQEEVNRVIGSRQVQSEDRKNLPFTDAVIHETQRLANIAPVAGPHRMSQDVTFQGHFIKK